MNTNKDTPRCEKRVLNSGLSITRTHQCTKPGKMQHDGKWYCGVHNPERKAERERLWLEKFDADRKRDMQTHLDNGHRYRCFDPLLASLKAIMENGCPLTGNPTHAELIEFWEYEKSQGRGDADIHIAALNAIHHAENGPKA